MEIVIFVVYEVDMGVYISDVLCCCVVLMGLLVEEIVVLCLIVVVMVEYLVDVLLLFVCKVMMLIGGLLVGFSFYEVDFVFGVFCWCYFYGVFVWFEGVIMLCDYSFCGVMFDCNCFMLVWYLEC